MKKCNRCKKIKPIECFNLNTRDGFQRECVECCNTRLRETRRTKNGLISQIYRSQKKGSIKRGYPLPLYSKEELIEWANSQSSFNILYNNWVKSGYNKNLTPSIDRINDYKSYTFDNIQLITWEENINKAHADRINGINNKTSKAVLQYSLNEDFIKEYHSLAEAERQTGVFATTITQVCLNKYKQSGGYIWRYKNNCKTKTP
jgi:hypothetical protein